jgi:hypothetical protein
LAYGVHQLGKYVEAGRAFKVIHRYLTGKIGTLPEVLPIYQSGVPQKPRSIGVFKKGLNCVPPV